MTIQNPFAKLMAEAELARAELEAHQAECAVTPCKRCQRYTCKHCGGVAKDLPECLACLCRIADDKWKATALETIPAAFDKAHFDAEWLARLVGAQAMQRAGALIASPRVAFIGPPGSGKTSLAVAMLRAAVDGECASRPGGVWSARRPCRHRYVSAHALAKARSIHPLGDGEAPLVKACLEADLLVIDELGGEDARHASAVSEVIYERHAALLPTWVTTGTTPEKLAERYSGGIGRRLFEDAEVLKLVGRRR